MKKKGLTLIELLIVLLIMSILSIAAIFTSSEIVASAKATRIINNLTVLKQAALAYYSDNTEKFIKNVDSFTKHNKEENSDEDKIFKYAYNLLNKFDQDLFKGYHVFSENNDMTGRFEWRAVYQGDDINVYREESKAVRQKLAGRAKTAGLYTGDGTQKLVLFNTDNSSNRIYMVIR